MRLPACKGVQPPTSLTLALPACRRFDDIDSVRSDSTPYPFLSELQKVFSVRQ